MCDQGHVTIELLHRTEPPKLCSIEAGSFEIDFVTGDIHIYHCPCHAGCKKTKCCHRCERNLFHPVERTGVHRCRDPISKIRIISKECSDSRKETLDAKIQTNILELHKGFRKYTEEAQKLRSENRCPKKTHQQEEKNRKPNCDLKEQNSYLYPTKPISISQNTIYKERDPPFRWKCRVTEKPYVNEESDDNIEVTDTNICCDDPCKDKFNMSCPSRLELKRTMIERIDSSLINYIPQPKESSENILDKCMKVQSCKEIIEEIIDSEIDKDCEDCEEDCNEPRKE